MAVVRRGVGLRPLALYLIVLLTFGAGIAATLKRGKTLEHRVPSAAQQGVVPSVPADSLSQTLAGSVVRGRLARPLGLLLLELVVIVLVARLLGAAFERWGQPAVVGEIVGGIVLGPSVLGAAAPQAFAFLFRPTALAMLELFAQIGVVLFLFVVGLDLDLSLLRGKATAAIAVSHASILVPYFLGVVLSLFLYPELAPPGVSFSAFALFLGIAMSITAFPVLARILSDRGMTRTPLGSTAITCAAVDDVTAWSLLALVVGVAVSKGWTSAAWTIGLALAFTAAMLGVVRPLLARAVRGRAEAAKAPGKTAMAATLVLLLGSALATEAIGIHALFGAFLAGLVMPRAAKLRRSLTERLEEVSGVFLLPVFFAFTGLRTQIGLLNDLSSWLLCAVIILVATAGKLGAGMLAARWTGMDWIDAFSLGALMNTRGLMELIALNVGYDLKILSPRIYTMMVLMALITTFATGPLLSAAERQRRRARRESYAVNAVAASRRSPTRNP